MSEVTGSPQALMNLFVPRHMPHGPVLRPTRAQRREARLQRLDNWTRALRIGFAEAGRVRRAVQLTQDEMKLIAAGEQTLDQFKRRQRNLRRRIRQGRTPLVVKTSPVSAASKRLARVHWCSVFNNKKTEKKRRVHLRQCLRESKTCACTKALAAGLGYVR